MDEFNNEPIPFAAIVLTQGSTHKHATACDIEGKYKFQNIKPGKYQILARVVGYQQATDSLTITKMDTVLVKNIKLTTKIDRHQLIWLLPYFEPLPPVKIKKCRDSTLLR